MRMPPRHSQSEDTRTARVFVKSQLCKCVCSLPPVGACLDAVACATVELRGSSGLAQLSIDATAAAVNAHSQIRCAITSIRTPPSSTEFPSFRAFAEWPRTTTSPPTPALFTQRRRFHRLRSVPHRATRNRLPRQRGLRDVFTARRRRKHRKPRRLRPAICRVHAAVPEALD